MTGYINKADQLFIDILKELEDDLNIMDDEEKTKHIHTLEYSSRYFRRYLRNGL